MIHTADIVERLSRTLGAAAAQDVAWAVETAFDDLQERTFQTEFRSLHAVLQRLSEAQERSEGRLDRLAQVVAELAEAQKRSEARLDRLEQVVAELAEAQKRTEARVAELAEAQRRTEARLDDTNKQLGGLSATVGYTLENEAYRHLPALLAKDYALEMAEPLDRDYVTDRQGRDWEVNILGRGRWQGRSVTVVGESKVQLSTRDVDRFVDHRVAALKEVLGEVFPVIVAHMTTQKAVRDHARSRGVALYLSSRFGR
ncbi:MAG: chordopoxvirus fusion protein [Verrucomicrobiales bacterium]|nr:chordopoxvirus fusion protein [Verrucomicrobiales bacterium]